MDKPFGMVPDWLHDQEETIVGLATEELFEFYLNLGYSEEDAMKLSGLVADSEEEQEISQSTKNRWCETTTHTAYFYYTIYQLGCQVVSVGV